MASRDFAVIAMAESVDCLRIEFQFFKYRLVVLSNFRCALRRTTLAISCTCIGLPMLNVSIPLAP